VFTSDVIFEKTAPSTARLHLFFQNAARKKYHKNWSLLSFCSFFLLSYKKLLVGRKIFVSVKMPFSVLKLSASEVKHVGMPKLCFEPKRRNGFI